MICELFLHIQPLDFFNCQVEVGIQMVKTAKKKMNRSNPKGTIMPLKIRAPFVQYTEYSKANDIN